MTTYTAPPWYMDGDDDEIIIIRGSDGDSICAMRRATGDRLPNEQDANAALMYLAPELFRAVVDLVDVMSRSDIDTSSELICSEDDLDRALDDAQALIDLLADEGVQIDSFEADESHPANRVDRQPATVSYPTGSLGECVDDQAWLS